MFIEHFIVRVEAILFIAFLAICNIVLAVIIFVKSIIALAEVKKIILYQVKERYVMALPEKVFCENCRKEVTYNVIVDENSTRKVGDTDVIIDEAKAYCQKCGSEIYVDELNDYNLDQIQNKLKEGKK